MRLVLLSALLLAGCTSTRYVDATSMADIAGAEVAAAGRTADVTLVSGDRYRGRVHFLRLDSTAWAAEESIFVVPTAAVRSLLVDARPQIGSAALRGAGAAAASCILAGAAVGDGLSGLIYGLACAPAGVLLGVVGEGVRSGRTEIILFDPVADSVPAGPSE